MVRPTSVMSRPVTEASATTPNTGEPADRAEEISHAGDEILTSVKDGVCVITLNRPEVRNAMNPTMSTAYATALRAADDDPAVRAIVITGAGAGFCSGADLGVLRGGADTIRAFLPRREDLPDLALRVRKPVIAAVNGSAVGIGFAYMLFSDVRIVAESAKLMTSFSQLGLVAEYGVSWLLPRLIGLAPAMDLLLTGRTVTAQEAVDLGLANRVVPDGTALEAAVTYATDLARHCAPASLAAIKEQLYADQERSRADALTDTLAKMDASFDAPGLAEALRARSEKRAPVFDPLPPRA